MKLYYAPAACSLADHIALNEAGLSFDRVKVDLRTKRTEDGSDYTQINPKGYVPALVLDDGEMLTENVAILDWITERCPALAPAGALGRTRQLEMLAFISSELHKQFSRAFAPSGDAEKAAAFQRIEQRLAYLAGALQGDYLFGERMTAADAYLYVVLRWAGMMGRTLPAPLAAFQARVEARPAVRRALEEEGLKAG